MCIVFIDDYVFYYNHRQHETNTHRSTRMSVIMSFSPIFAGLKQCLHNTVC